MHKNELLVSVIVPIYNVEPYIRRCLDSIIDQTYKNLEIILVDDGSTDRSGKICDEYALIDSRIKIIHKKNGGIVSARKAGIIYATGEYVTDVDPDDWIERNAYEYIVEKLNLYNPDMFVIGYQKEYKNGFSQQYKQKLNNGLYRGKEISDEFNCCVEKMEFFGQPIDMLLWNKVIKTKIRKQYQMKAPDLLNKGEDDAVIFPCLLNVDSIYIDSKCFYHYCVRESSVLWNDQGEDYKHFLVLAEHLIKVYINTENKRMIEKDYLLYQLFYQLLLYNPEKLIVDSQCMIYPQVQPNSNIIVYGKGVFAHRLIERINALQYCHVIDNIDKLDIERVQLITEFYDFIVIAITRSEIVSASIELLMKMGVDKNKILFIDKKCLTFKLLPEELKVICNTFLQEEI